MALVALAIFVHVVPLVLRCHWYVIAPVPVAAALDVNGSGTSPMHIVWFAAIVPALVMSFTVTVTTLLLVLGHPVITIPLLYCILPVSTPGA